MSDDSLKKDFAELGENLTEVLRAAWDRSERKAVQDQITGGLNELGATLNNLLEEFTSSESGQKIKSDLQDLRERAESGEIEKNVEQEVKTAFQTVNRELTNLAQKIRETEQNKDPEN